MTALEQVKHIIEALQERKGQEIEVLKVEQLTTSTTQVKALADSVEFHMKNDYDIMVHHTEGFESAQWILLDFGAVVVHIFLPESRQFYNLENLWKDGVPVRKNKNKKQGVISLEKIRL